MDYDYTFPRYKRGDIIKGRVVHVDNNGVLVDIGSKSEGIIPINELSERSVSAPSRIVKVGDVIDVYVLKVSSEEGNLVLSKRRANYENRWQKVEQIYEDKSTIMGRVVERAPGGFIVDVGIRGFLPMSQLHPGGVKGVPRLLGKRLRFKVVEVDRGSKKVVLSHSQVVEEDRTRKKAAALSRLEEGKIYSGKVKTVTNFGAFIDLGGIDGLLHISEMSWTRINHPREVLKVGQRVRVMVLKLDPEGNKIALGLKQTLRDPWLDFVEQHRAGDLISGRVNKLCSFGAFVRLPSGVEGMVPISEIAPRRIARPEDEISVGERVDVKILEINLKSRKLTLSIRQAQQEKERKYYEDYIKRQREERPTVGELYKGLFDKVKAADRRKRKFKERGKSKRGKRE